MKPKITFKIWITVEQETIFDDTTTDWEEMEEFQTKLFEVEKISDVQKIIAEMKMLTYDLI